MTKTMHMKTTAVMAAAVIAASAAFCGAARAADQKITLKSIGTISGFSGRTFRNMQGFWLDQPTDSFYVIDTSPNIVGQFDRQGMPLKFMALDDDIESPSFAGRVNGVTYIHSKDVTLAMSENYEEATEAKFFFVPPPQPDVEPPAAPEKYPLKFSIILPGPDKSLLGYDPAKKNIYKCDAAGDCRVFIRTLMKYGADVMTGVLSSIYRDPWGRYLLVDPDSKQVWRFSHDGRFLGRALQMIDIERDRLFKPEFAAVDRTKRCYIYDSAVRKIKVYDDLGLFIAEIDLQDAANNVFLVLPAGMEIDDFGRLYIWDRGDMTMKIFQISVNGF